MTSDSLLRELALALTAAGRARDAVALVTPRAAQAPDLLGEIGQVLSEAGNQGEARRLLEPLLERDPDNPMLLESLALGALREGRWAETRDRARAALELDPGLSLAWNYLGGALYNLGDRTGAVDALAKAVDSDPSNYDALFNLAVVAREAGATEHARSALERFVTDAPAERYRGDIERAKGWLDQLEP